MKEHQMIWARSRDSLTDALTQLGFPGELGDLLARQLQSPRAIDRMTSYVRQARPKSMEMLADEMLAIRAEIDAWREKKASQEAQAHYNAMLFYGGFGEDDEEEETFP